MNIAYKIQEYIDDHDKNPFRDWFFTIDARAAAKITTALLRLEAGNTSNSKSVGGGVYEIRINFGPGYRVYYAYEGKKIVILLGGGIKKRQSKDVEIAKTRWIDYKERKENAFNS